MAIDSITPPTPKPVEIPPLENGDRLTRAEFERRYEAMPFVKKAELIDGVVYLPSPPPAAHGRATFKTIGWLGTYAAYTPGVEGGANSTVRLDLENEPQPDAFIMVASDRGGQARIDEDGYVAGAPEFIAEVAASSASYDLHDKLRAYRRNSVREYLVWRVLDEAIDWFVLREGVYERLPTDDSGVCRSEVLPGLWLDTRAMLRGDMAGTLAVLQQGIASPEHAAFVGRLADAATSP